MKLLETYLKRATIGLIGKKRLEIREELTAHLLERARKYEIAGLTHHDALAKAIEELGDAQTIRAGMIGVHTMPKIYASTGLAAIVAAGILATLSVSSAQVIGTLRVPLEQCQASSAQTVTLQTPLGGKIEKFPCEQGDFWLEFASLRATLEPLGVKIERANVSQLEDSEQFYLNFPDGATVSLYLQKMFYFKRSANDKLEKIPYVAGYVEGSTLIEAFRTAGVSFTMSGWNNPVLRIGKTRFQIGTATAPIRGENFYLNALQARLFSLFNGWTTESSVPDTINNVERQVQIYGAPSLFRSYKHRIQTGFAAGQIVVVASREPTYSFEYEGKTLVQPAFTRTYITPVGKDGILEYPSDAKTLRFKDDLRSLSVTPKDGAGDIAVLKFTSDLSYNKKSFELVPSSKLSK